MYRPADRESAGTGGGNIGTMKEISGIIIEEYCQNHKTKKAKQLERLVEMSFIDLVELFWEVNAMCADL